MHDESSGSLPAALPLGGSRGRGFRKGGSGTEGSRTPSRLESFAARWRWYYLYFVLAAFDLFVIVASLALHHQTLHSYQICLDEVAELERVRAWSNELRSVLVSLNAPGNDIFESRDVAAEVERFTEARIRFETLKLQASRFEVDFDAVNAVVGPMIEAEQRIFELFRKMESLPTGDPTGNALISSATAVMAQMDRAQADTLDALVEIEDKLSRQDLELRSRYGRELERRAELERYFVLVLLLILGTILLYGRKLHFMHQRMLEDQRRLAVEGTKRLAAIGEVCASFAHAMRNPLAGVRAAAEVSRESLEAGPVADTFGDIIGEVDRLDGRMKRLLDFSRPFTLDLVPLDLAELIRQVAQSATLAAQRAGIQISVVPDPPKPVIVNGDRTLLEEIFEELISNARQAMTEGGKLTLSLSAQGGEALVRVIDQGKGMTPDVQKHLFELFFTTRIQGSGMGLATVRRSVELHGGTISVLESNSSGSVFEIRLPLV